MTLKSITVGGYVFYLNGERIICFHYDNLVSLEMVDCYISAGNAVAVCVGANVPRFVVHRCEIVSDSTTALSVTSEEAHGARRNIRCFDTFFQSKGDGPVSIGGKESNFFWERCRFIAGSRSYAAFGNSLETAPLFNSCEFVGGKEAIAYGAAKCYDCTFSGKVSFSKDVEIVNTKLAPKSL